MKVLYHKVFGSRAQERAISFAVLSLICNLLYAFYHGALGLQNSSVWFGSLCLYYLLLAIMRFVAVFTRRREGLALSFTGSMLAVLSMVLGGILYVSLAQNTASSYGTIPMLTIATYTFTKLTLAIITAIRQRRDSSPTHAMIRTIRYAQVAVSILTMQQSMLLSFGDGGEGLALNVVTGLAVCLFTLFLGITLIKKSRKEKQNGKVQARKSK